MLKKIVIAADSFKGSITSAEFADVCEGVAAEMLPACRVVKVPLGDGGEGTIEALTSALHGHKLECEVCGPLMERVVARYGISADGQTAIMEMSQASGLTLIPPERRNPLATTTYGTGQMIADALAHGCRRIVIGVGGSATNDGGIGMLSALGFRFYDSLGRHMSGGLTGADLDRVASFDFPAEHKLDGVEFLVACDVDNPFCGPSGAAPVFAAQKGADAATIERLDSAMAKFAELVRQRMGSDIATMAGAGAAGGLGGAFAAFLGGKLKPGIEMVLDAVGFDRLIEGADLIVTGEGRIDSQTVRGKTPFGVLQAARRKSIPVIALGGSVVDSPELDAAGFAAVMSIQQSPVTLEEAMRPETSRRNLAATFRQLLSLIETFS